MRKSWLAVALAVFIMVSGVIYVATRATPDEILVMKIHELQARVYAAKLQVERTEQELQRLGIAINSAADEGKDLKFLQESRKEVRQNLVVDLQFSIAALRELAEAQTEVLRPR